MLVSRKRYLRMLAYIILANISYSDIAGDITSGKINMTNSKKLITIGHDLELEENSSGVKDVIYIGNGKVKEVKQKLYAKETIVIGGQNEFKKNNDSDLYIRNAIILGQSNVIDKGNNNDAGGGSPLNNLVYGHRNKLHGSYASSIGIENEVMNSSKENRVSQAFAFAIGKENKIHASSYVIGDKNKINTVENYELEGYEDKTGSNLYVLGRNNIIGSSDKKNNFVDTGVVTGSDNIVRDESNYIIGDSNTVEGFYNSVHGFGNKVVNPTILDDQGNKVSDAKYPGNKKTANAVAIGNGNTASDWYAVAIGTQSEAIGSGTVSMGYYNKANSRMSTAVGYENKIGEDSIASSAYGFRNRLSSGTSIALGLYNNNYNKETKKYNSEVKSGANSAAVGLMNASKGNYSIAYGTLNVANSDKSTAMGYSNDANGDYSQAIGVVNTAGERATSIGYYNQALGRNSISMGQQNYVDSYGAISIGSQNNNNFIKKYESLGFKNTGLFSTAIGRSNYTAGKQSNAFGFGNETLGDKSLAVGNSSISAGYETIAIGDDVLVISDKENYELKRAIALGSNSKATVSDGVALGSFSVADREKGSYGYDILNNKVLTDAEILEINGKTGSNIEKARTKLEEATKEYESTLKEGESVLLRIQTRDYNGQEEYDALVKKFEELNTKHIADKEKLNEAQKEVSKLVGAWQSQMGAISIGDKKNGRTRQITGLAAGTNDEDAVNVAQLKRIEEKLNNVQQGGASGNLSYKVGEEKKKEVSLNTGLTFIQMIILK